MMSLALSEIARVVDGRLFGEDRLCEGISTDTRSLHPGQLFVALRGPNFDGHDYLGVARQSGAAGALVEHRADTALASVAVPDALAGLGALGRHWRRQQPARVVAVTGSNGKTTLKEMIAAILSRRGSVMATRGNLNNAIGVPLTLSRLGGERFAVIELGANHAGEIDYLTRLAGPDIAVLNNAGRAHLEGFGSLEGVAKAKAEIIHGLGPDGLFVFNADDAFAAYWRDVGHRFRQRTFGVQRPADVSSPVGDYRVAWYTDRFEVVFPVRCDLGEVDISLQMAGGHNRMNALAATAAATGLGAGLDDAREALAQLKPVPGRLCPVPGRAGSRLIDDSYNANPDSVAAALQVLETAPGRRTLVLGDLAELGPGAGDLHRQLGGMATAAGIDRVLGCGPLSREACRGFSGESRHFDGREALVDWLGGDLSGQDTLLIKGSRSAGMDEVVTRLRAEGDAC